MSSELARLNSTDLCASTMDSGSGVNWWAVAGYTALGVGALGLAYAIGNHYGEEAGRAAARADIDDAQLELARLSGIRV